MKSIHERFTKRTLLSILVFHFSMLSFAATYYISPTGNDATGDGSISKPYFTLNKVWTVLGAGDTVYLRGGTYAFNTQQSLTGKNGTSGNLIKIFAYPNETPVLTKSASYNAIAGIYFEGNYFHWKGIEITGFVQLNADLAVIYGMRAVASSYNTFENFKVHGNGCGFSMANNLSTTIHCTGNLFLNCDFYENQDPLTTANNYGNADGLSIAYIGITSDTNTIRGCRFWWNSDDGIDLFYNDGVVVIEDCQVFYNGYIPNTFNTGGDGIGIKLGDSSADYSTSIKRIVKNCLAVKNRRHGFGQNGLYGIVEMYNCTGYLNTGLSFSMGIHLADFNIAHTVKNCIAYANTMNPNLGASTTSVTNSWQNGHVVNDADFVSVNHSLLLTARQANGSLPVTDFLKLASTSDLLNCGTIISGITYNGSAPDLGAYESGSIDATAPVVTAFTIPATSTSLTVSLSSFTATDNVGVVGYLLTETSSTPSSVASGWSSTKPTTYVFTTIGSKTLYAWAKDAAGNISASLKADIVISSPVASAFTFNGPSSGNVNSASTNFTVTPNNLYTGSITITPSGTGSTGLSARVLTFTNSSTAQTFTITPTVAGSITLTPSNSGTLTNPANITYTVNAVVPNAPTSVVATSGDASALVNFIAPTNTGGSAITGYTVTSIPAGGIDANAGSTALTHTITGLINGISYTFTVKATNSVGSSVASVTSNSVIPVVTNVIIKQGEIIPSHFTTVWQGLNGLNQMNINVVAATFEDIPLSADDEIAVFSGSACVGALKLTKSIVPSDNTTFVTILASQNDGSGNGFIDNDTIVFKIWNNKTQSELQINSVVYHTDIPTWKANGRYSPASTSVVEIASYQVYTQQIELLKGYNMISTYVSAQNPNVSAVTKTLVDQGNLIKMQDETGNSLENWGDFGGWVNKLGSLEETEGYKIQVANNCTLQVTGRYIAMPFDIALKTGWNIISFPRTDLINAMNVVQSLIDQNNLVKVQDEAGNSIENWGLYGGWKNGIGNFIPGKAYKVKMNADAILTFQESYPKSAVVIAQSEQTEYYHSSVEGNGTDHMNINITGLNNIGISVGDELAAFDGAVCVATTKITEANLLSSSACLASSFSTNDQNPNGFKVGNSIQISVWNKLSGDESKVNAEVVTGQLRYEKNASVLVKMKSATITTGITNFDDVVKIDVFPNPCQGRVIVRFSEIPEANSRIEISDISGRKLISRLISGTSEEFNLDSFTPGLYLVKSILGSSEFIQKLIVNK